MEGGVVLKDKADELVEDGYPECLRVLNASWIGIKEWSSTGEASTMVECKDGLDGRQGINVPGRIPGAQPYCVLAMVSGKGWRTPVALQHC